MSLKGTTTQFQALIKEAKKEGVKTSSELYDLILEKFSDESKPITGADYETAKKMLKIKS
jgi:hypothetical protein